MKKTLFLLILPLLAFSKFQITVYMPIEEFFIKKIAQNYVRAKKVALYYTDKPIDFKYSDLSRLAQTRAYFHFGLDIEKSYISKFKEINPQIKVFDLSKGIKKLELKNGKINPYIWTDPLLLRVVASNIYNALIQLDSINKEHYKRNYELLLTKLDKLFLDIRANLYKSDIYNIYVFDDYWDYFANRFSLNLYKREKKIIKADTLKDLESFTKTNEIKAILIQGKKTDTYVKSLASKVELPLKKHDIFEELFFFNLESLSKKLSN
ncbi:metal ABC transporter solute-binding protein, Zn/Mn family [Arcobacter sp. YIC-310]|uniref:metal ABC transporter solute-binding protein, Zn/Mn family n=1 Tax=Arcobacter sp. YIC-310 TaxID=3376632 RepID=UPI003C235117